MVKYSQQEVRNMKLSLAEARRLRNKTQADMGNILGITAQTYRKLELDPGLIRMRDAKIISDYLKIPLEDLQFIKNDDAK